MKKVINHESVELIYGFLSKSMYNKMSVNDRTIVLVTLRQLKEKKQEFDKAMRELGKRMCPDGYEDRRKEAEEIKQEYAKEFGKIDSNERFMQFNKELEEKFPKYAEFINERDLFMAQCNKALDEHKLENVELDIQKLTEKGYQDLLSSNPWNFEMAELMHKFFIEED